MLPPSLTRAPCDEWNSVCWQCESEVTSDKWTKVRAPRGKLVSGLRRDQCEVVLEGDSSAFIQA